MYSNISNYIVAYIVLHTRIACKIGETLPRLQTVIFKVPELTPTRVLKLQSFVFLLESA